MPLNCPFSRRLVPTGFAGKNRPTTLFWHFFNHWGQFYRLDLVLTFKTKTGQELNVEPRTKITIGLVLDESTIFRPSSTLVGNSNEPPQKYCILDVIKRLINQSRLVQTGRNWLKLVETGPNCQNWSKLVMAFLVQRPTGPLSEHFWT